MAKYCLNNICRPRCKDHIFAHISQQESLAYLMCYMPLNLFSSIQRKGVKRLPLWKKIWTLIRPKEQQQQFQDHVECCYLRCGDLTCWQARR